MRNTFFTWTVPLAVTFAMKWSSPRFLQTVPLDSYWDIPIIVFPFAE